MSTRPIRAASALAALEPDQAGRDDDDPERPDRGDEDLRPMGRAGRRQVMPVAAAVGEGDDRRGRRGGEGGRARPGRTEQRQQDRCGRGRGAVCAIRETDGGRPARRPRSGSPRRPGRAAGRCSRWRRRRNGPTRKSGPSLMIRPPRPVSDETAECDGHHPLAAVGVAEDASQQQRSGRRRSTPA